MSLGRVRTMSSFMTELVTGLRAPLRVLGGAGVVEARRRYARLVARQLLLVTLIISVATPGILRGVRAVEENPSPPESVAARPRDQARHGSRRLRIEVRHGDSHVAFTRGHADEDPGRTSARRPGASAEGEEGWSTDAQLAGTAWIAAHAPSLLFMWMALLALYAAWTVAELFIYALHREHIDQVTDALAHAAGLPARARSGPPRAPRMRLDLLWALRRLWRQLLGLVVLGSAAPFLFAARAIPAVGPTLYTLVLGGWGAYWLLVTTAGKSEGAWTVAASRSPWFRRAWATLTTRVPGFRWWLPRTYGRLWKRVTRKLDRAAEIAEARPWAFLGLSLVRVAGNLPIASVLVRPLLPVAATALAAGAVATAAGSGGALDDETSPGL